MKAYKATNKKMQCIDFQFELNKEFIHEGKLILCENGFHFCKELTDVFYHYEFSPKNRFWEVEIPDNAEVIDDYCIKSVTNKIKFIRELSLDDIKELTNGEHYVDTDGGWITGGYKHFYNKNGQLHRVGGPAAIYPNGRQEYWENGNLKDLLGELVDPLD